jgi:nijmegen breakage syndrome protein 1
VAARKRNTAKGLQALIDGRYIVDNERYIDALIEATSSEEGPCSLELDFDGNFPKELDFLPPRGDEPTSRDASAYAPDSARKGMFEGYTFVFYEQRQFNTLMAPITQGGGKALCHTVVPGKTEVLEFVQYVKNVAGEKGVGSFDDGGEGKGVVVVRFNPGKGEALEWFKNFNQEVSLQLDHRFIEQNEFLDAILGADASVLRRPLDVVDNSSVAAPQLGMSLLPDALLMLTICSK